MSLLPVPSLRVSSQIPLAQKLRFGDVSSGFSRRRERIFEQERSLAISIVTGDMNPINLNTRAAQAYGFESPPVHDLHILGECSRACTNDFFEAGVLIKTLSAEFKRPVYHGELYIFELSLHAANRQHSVREAHFHFSVLHSRLSQLHVSGTLVLRFPI